jgi:hypothetical protein
MLRGVENEEEEDWIFVVKDYTKEDYKVDLKCDLCDRNISAFILCDRCKTNQRPITKNPSFHDKKEEKDCQECKKKFHSLFPCEFCLEEICVECKFGDDCIQKGKHDCQLSKMDETENFSSSPTESVYSSSPTTKTFFFSHPSHEKLFQEFLSLR